MPAVNSGPAQTTTPNITVVGAAAVAATFSRALAQGDAGFVLDNTTAATFTIPPGLVNFSCIIIPPSSGNLTIAVGPGVTINGGTGSLTRTLANNPAGVSIIPTSVTDAYRVSGS